MLLLAAQTVARFLDNDFSFIMRGIAFMGLGMLFLLANWIAIRRREGGCDGK